MGKGRFFLCLCLVVWLSACDRAPTPATLTTFRTPTAFSLPCQLVRMEPTPTPESSIFPPLGPGDFVRGPEEALLTVLVYSDFQCRSCADLAVLLETLRTDHPNEVRIAYRHLPLAEKNDKSVLAAQAAEAAALQGKFWDMHDLLYGKQSEWLSISPSAFQDWAAEQAIALGLDRAQFLSDMQGEKVREKVQEAVALAALIPVPPLVLINGRLQSGTVSYYSLDTTLHLLALAKRQFSSCPPFVIDPQKQYLATLHTEKGDIVIQLFADKTPFTVNNFVFLARQGWFNGVTFHRVLPGFVAQTGDPSGTGMGGPGYFIPNEPVSTLRYNRPGLVGMANSGPDLNGSQFFITLAPAPHLDGQYTLFGEVISGMEVLSQLTPRDPQPGIWLPPGDLLISVNIEER